MADTMSIEDRAVAAVLGAAVADAACQPVHWNYNRAKLDDILRQHNDPEFIKTSQNPFYCIETGRQSCYGDQAYAVLKSLVDSEGVDEEDMKQKMYGVFGPGTEYENSTVDKFKCKSNLGDKSVYPVKGPWKHFSIKHFLKNYEAGNSSTGSETDTQIDSVTKIAPIVALYAGRPEMLSKVEEMVSITQDDDVPKVFAMLAARILERIILYGNEEDVVKKVLAEVRSNDRANPHPLDSTMPNHINKVLDLNENNPIKATEILGKS